MTRTRTVLTSTLLVAVVAAPLSPAYAIFDKTRFALHLGAAYFAFHHWDLKPYQQGKFSAGAPGRTASMVKGGLALAFAAHEVSVARKVAHNSGSPVLQKLDAGLNNLSTEMSTLGGRLKGGNLDSADLKALDSDTQSLGAQSAAAGQPIKDVPVVIPGL